MPLDTVVLDEVSGYKAESVFKVSAKAEELASTSSELTKVNRFSKVVVEGAEAEEVGWDCASTVCVTKTVTTSAAACASGTGTA